MDRDTSDDNILEQHFRQHYKELCLYSVHYVNIFEIAEDIVQDVFVRLLIRPEKILMDNPKNYLYVSVRNASLNWLKNKKRHTLSLVEKFEEPQSPSVEEEVMHMEQKIALYKAIDKLPQNCKKVFLSCGMNGLKYKEAAELHDISINTVKDHMKKAYRIIRVAIMDIYGIF